MIVHSYENGHVQIARSPEDTALILPSPQHLLLAGSTAEEVDLSRPEFNLNDPEVEILGQYIDDLRCKHDQTHPSPERDKLRHDLELLMFAYLCAQRGCYVRSRSEAA